MQPSAHVKSIESLRHFRQVLKNYQDALQHSLESLSLESHKAMNWIEHDRARYWPRAAKEANDRLAEARNDLLRCKMAAMEGQRKSCQEEKDAVTFWVRRQRHCESQVKVVRQWRQRMRQESDEFGTKLARLSHYVENDLPKAIASLDRMIAALEKYAQPSASEKKGSS